MSLNSSKIESFDDIKEAILELLEDKDQEFIFLTGAAGTGKSTMLGILEINLI